jgi:hypothetical protein
MKSTTRPTCKHVVQELMFVLNDMFQNNGAHHANNGTIEHANGKFLDQEI